MATPNQFEQALGAMPQEQQQELVQAIETMQVRDRYVARFA